MSDAVISEPNSETRSANTGLRHFAAIWFSQFASALGAALTSFGLNVWVFQTTKSVTAVSLLAMCLMIPRVFSMVFAGTVVDRCGPHLAMVLGNLGTLLSLVPGLVLFWKGQPELWHVCVCLTLASAWQSLLWPAVSSAIPVLLGKQDFLRANGMLQAGNAASGIIAPLVGGLVALRYDSGAVLAIAIATYAVALPTLALIRIPRPEPLNERGGARSYMREIADAWVFLRRDATLFRLTVIFAGSSFIVAIATVLMKPLILSFGSASALGTVMAVGGVGLLLGGLIVTVSGKGASDFGQVMLLMGIAGFCMVIAGSRPVLPLIAVATLAYFFTMSIVSSGVQTIIQNSVPVQLQGRMHATLAATSLAAMPLAYPIAGPLADYVFEPLLAQGGPLAGSVGLVIGVGAGRGIGLLFIISGCLIVGLSLIGRIRPQKEPRRTNALAVGEHK